MRSPLTPLVDVDLERVELPLRAPLETARGTIERRHVVLIRLRDAEGRVGLGEAPPLVSAGTETPELCQRALEGLRELLLSPAGLPLDSGSWERKLLLASRGAPAARFGVDLALWDLAAKRADVPLAELLKPQPTLRVPVNALLSGDPAAAAARAERGGFGLVKLKVGSRSLERDEARVRAVREACGLPIRLDANGAWATAEQALDALSVLIAASGGRIESVEQPVPADANSELRAVRADATIPVAADEAVADEDAGLRLILWQAADRLVLKPARLGTLDTCLRLARSARGRGLDALVTTTLDGAVARAGALHLAAALHRSGGPAHGLATGGLLAQDLAVGQRPVAGELAIDPDRPGHGIEV